jgi:spore maturation protein CgeB
MKEGRCCFVFLGLSVSSSWGNGHASTYRGLLKELVLRGHEVLFLEREQSWYSANRDFSHSPHFRIAYYSSIDELRALYRSHIQSATAVVVGSFVPEGVEVGDFVLRTAEGLRIFYDIDTPETLRTLDEGNCTYLSPALLGGYDLYLSFTGGPLLRKIEKVYGARRARALYCSVDPEEYFPEPGALDFELAYLGTYSKDRQSTLDQLLVNVARQETDRNFLVAGAQYPGDIQWPSNIRLITHVSPNEHRAFFGAQRYTLNVTRSAMIRAGFSPSVRLFEAAACGTPIITDEWEGLDCFFQPGREILIARDSDDCLRHLRNITDNQRRTIASRARSRVLAEHTSAHRAREFEQYVFALLKTRSATERVVSPASLSMLGST